MKKSKCEHEYIADPDFFPVNAAKILDYGGTATCNKCGDQKQLTYMERFGENMTSEEYYIAPPQKVFDEIKQASIEIWNTYDNQFGYVDEKMSRIKDLENIQDNAWYMVAMFDSPNQAKLLSKVSPETATMIRRARGY